MAISKTNITGEKIRSTLSSLGGSVPTSSTAKVTAADLFKAAAKYWKWAKYKPVDYSEDFPSGLWWKGDDGACGLNVDLYNSTSALVSAMSGETNMDDLWTVNPPDGGSDSPYRLGDFAGHAISGSVIDSCSISSTSAYDGDSVMITVAFNNSNDNILKYTEIKYNGTFWSSLYIGYITYGGSAYGIYSQGVLSNIVIAGSSDTANLSIDYDAFNGPGTYTIYPVLFTSNENTKCEPNSISCNFIPLPVAPITFKFQNKNVNYSAYINSVSYNSSNNFMTINYTFNNGGTSPITFQYNSNSDSGSGVYTKTFAAGGFNDEPSNGVTDLSVTVSSQTLTYPVGSGTYSDVITISGIGSYNGVYVAINFLGVNITASNNFVYK